MAEGRRSLAHHRSSSSAPLDSQLPETTNLTVWPPLSSPSPPPHTAHHIPSSPARETHREPLLNPPIQPQQTIPTTNSDPPGRDEVADLLFQQEKRLHAAFSQQHQNFAAVNQEVIDRLCQQIHLLTWAQNPHGFQPHPPNPLSPNTQPSDAHFPPRSDLSLHPQAAYCPIQPTTAITTPFTPIASNPTASFI